MHDVTDNCPFFWQGVAPFGADIAVLAYNTGLEGGSPRMPTNLAAAAAGATVDGAAATGISTELVHERPELKILTWTKGEVASDALLITGTILHRCIITICMLASSVLKQQLCCLFACNLG